MQFQYNKEIHSIPDNFYLIAEIGINHNGSLDLAKTLIKNSKDAGFNAVKFQKRNVDVVYSKQVLDSKRESPWGDTTRHQKYGLEFTIEEYKEIDAYCKNLNIEWFVSCWDLDSQREMRIFDTPYNKIASAMAINWEFIEEVAKEQKVTFASTGMMEMKDIRKLVNILERHSCPTVLMHTVSAYPAKESDLNLNCIQTLINEFGLPVGYSGHEISTAPSIFAAMLGAVAIERHVTLDRAMYGSDQSASLEMAGMMSLCSTIRKINNCLGDGKKRLIEEEKKIAEKLRYWRTD